MTLAGERAVVTGGGRGIGAGIARVLADAGAHVLVVDVDGAAAEAVAARLSGAEAHAIDARDGDGLRRLAETIGTATVLVNAAGVQRVGPSETLDEHDWDTVIGVNLTASFRCCQVFGQSMLAAGRGAIVNVTSISAHVGMPGRAPYCAAKSGLLGLTRALAVEWASRGVRVNAVAPGYVRTPMIESAIRARVVDEDAILARVPAGRLATTEEVADVVLFLASSASAFVTGQTIVVDGGYLAYGAPGPTSFVPQATAVQ